MSQSGFDRFATARLLAERITPGHFEEICRLHRDPRVMRTLSADGKTVSDEATLAGLEAQALHWEQHGFGLWVFRSRDEGRFIGRGGLKRYSIDEGEVVGLAYSVVFDEWGKGYATEIAAASLRFGFETLGCASIASWTLPENVASQRVMEKVGFCYERDFTYAGLRHRFYRVSATHAPAVTKSAGLVMVMPS